jgi:hypothetical protein
MRQPIRCRKVRRILRLEAQAEREATREARAAGRARRLGRRADGLRAEARALEASLTPAQRAELVRARIVRALEGTPPRRPRPRPHRTSPPGRCPRALDHDPLAAADAAGGPTEA